MISNDIKVPVYQPDLTGNEKKYVMECLESSWISSKGRFIGEFESRFGEFIGAEFCASTSNGTTAIQLAVSALGLSQGDEVLVPSFTYIASVNPITQVGAVPVFVDSEVNTWNIDVPGLKKHLTSRTKAVMAVHLYGVPCDMTALQAFCRENGLYLIEDCAEAFGSYHQGMHVGTFGDIATFSFFGNKTITTGEGGMVVSKNEFLHRKVLAIKGQGLSSYREYWHDSVGFNYRMTNICAAIGLAQLERAPQILEGKKKLAESYRSALAGLPLEFQGCLNGDVSSHWMVSVLVKDKVQRDPLRKALRDVGIETRPLFYPVHTMPMYSNRFQSLPVGEDIALRGINLPSWQGVGDRQLAVIIGATKAYFG